MIPKIIHMCYKDLKILEKYAQNWKKLNPEYELHLYDDSLCRQFLIKNFSELYVKIFNYIRDGPIKADFWRVCILYIYGGVYADADIVPIVPLDNFIEKNIDFLTCTSKNFYDFFNPNFIVSAPNNIFLKKCIDIYVKKYENKERYAYISWSIVNLFNFHNVINKNFLKKKNGIYRYETLKIQLLEEKSNYIDVYKDYMMYNNQKIFMNRYKNYDYKKHKFN